MNKEAQKIALAQHYNGEVPEYIKAIGKSYVTIAASDWRGSQHVKITIKDVVDYYETQARNISSGIREIAGLYGDWRQIDSLAKECLEWFKFINRPALKREGKKRGMLLRG